LDKRDLNWITWGFVVVTVLIVALMLMNTLHRPGEITLPDTSVPSDQSTENPDNAGALTVITITPDTVQTAIATLARPDDYRREITVEQFWDGGSGTYELTAAVSRPWTRTDRTMPDGQIRHTITGEDTAYIWYNNESDVYTAPMGDFSADGDQYIPTYENVLELPKESIVVADFRLISGVNCIYVETAPDQLGYVLRYWVSVDSGLLVAAEKLVENETVYRMVSLDLDQSGVTAEEFTLPNGTVLIS